MSVTQLALKKRDFDFGTFFEAPKSIAGYLECSRKHVYATLKRWVNEQFAGLADTSSRLHQPATKTTLRAMRGA